MKNPNQRGARAPLLRFATLVAAGALGLTGCAKNSDIGESIRGVDSVEGLAAATKEKGCEEGYKVKLEGVKLKFVEKGKTGDKDVDYYRVLDPNTPGSTFSVQFVESNGPGLNILPDQLGDLNGVLVKGAQGEPACMIANVTWQQTSGSPPITPT